MTMTRLLGQQERGSKEAEREQEKMGLRGGRKAGPLRFRVQVLGFRL